MQETKTKITNAERLREYNRKIKAGEIPKPKFKTPLEKAKANPKSLRAALNAECWVCSGYQRHEVTICEIKDCPLWKLRPWQPKSKKKD